MPPLSEHVAGRFKRFEDAALLRGTACFVDDVHLTPMLHAAFVRSQHAHAKLLRIDTTAAMQVEGVAAVFTYADLRPLLTGDRTNLALPSGYLRFHVDPFVLVKDEATYVGEPIAIVIANNRRVAEDAAALVIADMEPLPAVTEPEAALAPGSPKTRLDIADNLVAETRVTFGDIGAAFSNPALVVKERFLLHKGGGHSIEPRGVVASYDDLQDVLTVWDSTQMPHRCRTILCDMLNLAEHQVRVLAPEVGGAFGPKAVFHPEELAVSAAALLLRTSIKWIEDRFENFLATVMERDQVWDVELAVDREGHMLGLRGTVHHDHGAATPYGLAIPYNSATNLVGNYTLPALNMDVFWCMTNKVPTSSTRGAGRPQGTFVIERMLDRAAGLLGLDRLNSQAQPDPRRTDAILGTDPDARW